MQNAFWAKSVVLALDFGERVITNPVLLENDAKRIFQQKRRFGSRFRETVNTNAVLTQNDGNRIF